MEHYENFSLGDFIQDQYFILWVKYPNPESTQHWDAVKNVYPDKSEIIDKAREMVLALSSFHPEVDDAVIEKGRQVIISQINKPKLSVAFRKRVFLYAAASVLILLGFSIWWYGDNSAVLNERLVSSDIKKENRFYNKGKEPKKVVLSDGSVITLSSNSNVTCEMLLKGQRKVYLEGEAFFEVTKNANRPFYVYANGLTTKVLGTSFKVSAYDNGEEVKVEVNSGRVKVYSMENGKDDPESQGIVLTPNQSAVYRKKDMTLTRLVVEHPQMIITPENIEEYTYTDTPISEIFDGLEQLYGIKVNYDKKAFKHCRLNMVLTDESLFEKLELIGKVVEGRYNVIDGEVFFIGAGCNENQ